MPAPAQGALAIETRDDIDAELRSVVAALNDRGTALAASAERALMASLGAGCAAPVGALARVNQDDSALVIDARIVAVDGSASVEARDTLALTDNACEADAATAGRRCAQNLLAAGGANVADLRASKPLRSPS